MSKLILIVDDDAVTREMAAEFASALEYDIMVYSNGEDALRVAGQVECDIVLTDYQLGVGRMNGLALAVNLAEQLADRPKVILMNGRWFPEVEVGPQKPVSVLLQKPFTFAEFKRALLSVAA